jgi:hypothetical protein
MKAKVTTNIDPYLKASFEATAGLHGKTFSSVLEDGIQITLAEVSPLEYLKLMISQKEHELSEMRSRVAEIEVLESQKKMIAKKPIQDDYDSVFAEKREELFVTGAGTVMNMLKRNQTPNWKNFYMKYGFKSARDLEVFVRTEATKRGII